ncbi:MAG: transporter ATP-binding protein [Thermoleophilia bacterium]|nr:transporter ATP-binding protein [Thermoleophilia bacterium]
MPAPAATDASPAYARVAVDSVRRSFGTHVVLDDISFTREQPGIIGLLGANGSGKTTLLRILAQLTVQDSGTVTIAGREIDRGDDAAVRRLVGWAPHAPLAWLDETVRRNLGYAARLAGATRAEAARLTAASLTSWELDEVADSAVRRLSRGWQQRYALARADLFAPPVLLLDEPTTGLDGDARRLLEAALDQWRAERLVLVATHERDWISERSDLLLELERGRLL